MAADTTKALRTVRSPGFKFLLIVVLTVCIAVPLLLIQIALSDREQTAAGAANDIAAGWGGAQVVAGPYCLCPTPRIARPRQRTASGCGAGPHRDDGLAATPARRTVRTRRFGTGFVLPACAVTVRAYRLGAVLSRRGGSDGCADLSLRDEHSPAGRGRPCCSSFCRRSMDCSV